MKLNEQLFGLFVIFCRPYLASKDNDPTYPILRQVQNARFLRNSVRIWHTWLFLIWYHIGSAEIMFQKYPRPQLIEEPFDQILPTGLERRGFRGAAGHEKARRLINVAVSNGWLKMVEGLLWDVRGKTLWSILYQQIQHLPGCGTWAAYKWCDLCKNVIGCSSMEAPDIGCGGGDEHAGPIPGMVALTGENWKRCATDIALQTDLFNHCIKAGIPFTGMEEMETALCDFNSLLHGRYYVGHDIDAQQEHLMKAGTVVSEYWKARLISFPKTFLGECNGWSGERKNLNSYYTKTKNIFLGGKEPQ